MVNIPLFIGFQPSFWWCWIVPIRLAILERNSFCHYDPVPSDSREWPMQHRHERLQHVEFPHQGIIHQSLKRCSLLREEGAFWEEKMVELCWIHGMFMKTYENYGCFLCFLQQSWDVLLLEGDTWWGTKLAQAIPSSGIHETLVHVQTFLLKMNTSYFRIF